MHILVTTRSNAHKRWRKNVHLLLTWLFLCYTMMSFGLENTRATYQRMMDKVFKNKINKIVEVYINDIIMKTHRQQQPYNKIDKGISTVARMYEVRLNPSKCTFGFEIFPLTLAKRLSRLLHICDSCKQLIL